MYFYAIGLIKNKIKNVLLIFFINYVFEKERYYDYIRIFEDD